MRFLKRKRGARQAETRWKDGGGSAEWSVDSSLLAHMPPHSTEEDRAGSLLLVVFSLASRACVQALLDSSSKTVNPSEWISMPTKNGSRKADRRCSLFTIVQSVRVLASPSLHALGNRPVRTVACLTCSLGCQRTRREHVF